MLHGQRKEMDKIPSLMADKGLLFVNERAVCNFSQTIERP